MRSTVMFSALAAALLTTAAVPAFASPSQDVARSVLGDKPVVSSFGNCVRTKWDAAGDVCKGAPAAAPAPAAMPAPAPAPVRSAASLMKEEKNVYFEFNKTALLDSERAKLDKLATILMADQSVKNVKIVGYADRMGKAAANQKLSMKRAQEVENYLRGRGYLKTSAETKWLGDTAPATTCADNLPRAEKIKCLQHDRRVEVMIEYVK